MFYAKLSESEITKTWSLEFFNVPEDSNIKSNIITKSLNIGKYNFVNPFIQGNFGDWIMIEFWNSNQSKILDTSIEICKQFNIELILE